MAFELDCKGRVRLSKEEQEELPARAPACVVTWGHQRARCVRGAAGGLGIECVRE